MTPITTKPKAPPEMTTQKKEEAVPHIVQTGSRFDGQSLSNDGDSPSEFCVLPFLSKRHGLAFNSITPVYGLKDLFIYDSCLYNNTGFLRKWSGSWFDQHNLDGGYVDVNLYFSVLDFLFHLGQTALASEFG
ncbi:29835_t:CDS:2 [Gigaspora margarita]|uniref:29835_t:CDS:1 n=1 Tax=Gigaspora margarita TaxID=4874 RepID=A0ABN7VFU9_GIGMA|nr:29835_t:CDS:2 [Gigaspora margarita]